MAIQQISEEIRSNFHLFWDNFPHPVMLVHKDRSIIDANKTGKELGCPIGSRCVDLGEKKHHAACRANKALSQQTGVHEVAYNEHLEQVIDAYWEPLAGVDDLYVHFGIDISEYAAERLFPKKAGNSGRNCGDGCCGGL